MRPVLHLRKYGNHIHSLSQALSESEEFRNDCLSRRQIFISVFSGGTVTS